VLSSTAPFYLTNLLEYYTGIFVYSVGVMSGTTAQFIVIFLNIAAFYYGGGVFDWKVSETWTFMPGILADGFVFRDYVMVIVTYCGVFYSMVLLWKLYMQIEGLKNYAKLTMNVIQNFGIYLMMYMFNDKIKFIHDNVGLAYFSILLLFSLISTKLIVCLMAKMEFNIINFEYLVFVPYFYLQSQYDGTPESEQTLKLVFYATLFTILGLFLRLVHCCIDQITEYLGIHCFTIN